MKKKEVKIRLTEGELARLNDNVAKTGLSRETYLRLLISHRVPVELPPADYRALMRQLRQIQLCLINAPARPENGTDPVALQSTLQALDHTLLTMQHAAARGVAPAGHPHGKRGEQQCLMPWWIPVTSPSS